MPEAREREDLGHQHFKPVYDSDQELDLWHLPLADIGNAAGLPCSYFDDAFAHPERTMRYWQARNRLNDMLAIDIPVLHWTGWYDNFMGHMVEEWHWLRDANTPAGHNHLMIGPWDYLGTPERTHRMGLNDIGNGTDAHRWATYLAFFDRYMKGADNDFGASGPVHYFTLGANAWRDVDAWPQPCATHPRVAGVCSKAISMRFRSTLPAGHRLRVEVSSSEFDRYGRNPNTAAPFGRESQPVKARQTIHHCAAHPSHVVLPIMKQG